MAGHEARTMFNPYSIARTKDFEAALVSQDRMFFVPGSASAPPSPSR